MDQAESDTAMTGKLAELKGLRPEELEAFVVSTGLEAYRGRQLVAWIYRRGATDFGQMTDLSKEVRARLTTRASVLSLRRIAEVRSEDGDTTKYLLELPDGQRIESVLIYEGRRRTLCVSSQAGCALGCRFCATARMGFRRNLSAGEILDQLISVRRDLVRDDDDVTNVVMMGMGEPLHNYENVLRAIRIMNLDDGPAVGIRRITLSTVGHVPGILRLAEEGLKIGLAISLNATTDEQRDQIMPVNRSWPIGTLLDAVREYQQRIGRWVTFEYVLLHGFNDTPDDAGRLVKLVRGLPCKVNVIPWNPVDGAPFLRPLQASVDRFVEILADAHLTATIRASKGSDIAAGCGQLCHESASEKGV